MARLFALLTLVALLSACDTTANPTTAEVSTGVSYSGTTLRLVDAQTNALKYDYLTAGAQIGVEFETADSFTATLSVSQAALLASGETDDVDGDIDQEVTGTYAQQDGKLAFTQSGSPEGWADTFFDAEGWTIASDGSSIRYEDTEGDVKIEVVLTRQ